MIVSSPVTQQMCYNCLNTFAMLKSIRVLSFLTHAFLKDLKVKNDRRIGTWPLKWEKTQNINELLFSPLRGFIFKKHWLLHWQLSSMMCKFMGTQTKKKKRSCQAHIKHGVFNYKISRGGERANRFKSSHLISCPLEKASLIVPSEWADFSPQTSLDNSSFGSWRGVPSFTKYGAAEIALVTVLYLNNHLCLSLLYYERSFFSSFFNWVDC